MQTTHQQTIYTTYDEVAVKSFLWAKFISYCTAQERIRLLSVGVLLAVHGCTFTPITVMTTPVAGKNFLLFMCGMVAMGIALMTNLATMPPKLTVPTFVLSILIDIAVPVSCAFLILA